MLPNVRSRRTALVGALLGGAIVSSAAAFAAPERTTPFNVTIDSAIDMKMMGPGLDGMTQEVKAGTALDYTWTQTGAERVLVLDSTRIATTVNGIETLNTYLDRNKFVNTLNGETEEIAADEGTVELRAMLRGSFGAPLCRTKVDRTGAVLEQTVVAGPGAAALIDNGVISAALLFHPPYAANETTWSSQAAISMGNGGYARGTLTYTRAADADAGPLVPVDVSGTLTTPAFRQPGTNLEIRSTRYVVSGRQSYDVRRGEWTTGRLNVVVEFDMFDEAATQVCAAKGTMAMEFGRRAAVTASATPDATTKE